MRTRKNIIVSVVFICSMLTILSCEDGIEPTSEISNPVVILYDKTREAATQETLNSFLKEYNAQDKILSIKRDSVTSFVTEINFDKGVKIFDVNKVGNTNPITLTMCMDFFKKWEKLFGTNLGFMARKPAIYESNSSEKFSYKIFQNDYYNISKLSTPQFDIVFNYNGTIERIYSTLIPQFPLPVTTEVDTSKIMQKLLDKSTKLRKDIDIIVDNFFDDSYGFTVRTLNALYLEKYADKCLLYSLIVVGALKKAQPITGGFPIYYVYFHPVTNEVVSMKVIPGR